MKLFLKELKWIIKTCKFLLILPVIDIIRVLVEAQAGVFNVLSIIEILNLPFCFIITALLSTMIERSIIEKNKLI